MNRIQAQAAKLWQILFAQETAAAYQQTITLTGQILKESALLLWLVICIGLVFFEWFYKNSTQAGRSARNWINQQQEGETSPDRIASGLGRALLTAGQSSLTYTLAQAKEQLGLTEETQPFLESAAVATPSAPSVTPVIPAAPITPPATVEAPPAKPKD